MLFRITALGLLALGGCAATTPLVDMTDVNPVTYQRDLDYCQSIGTSYDPLGPVLVGALMGASVGFGAGAAAYGSGLGGVTVAEAAGGGAGAAAGAGLAAAANEGAVTLPEGVPQERVSVADCLRARGYKPLLAAAPAKP
jgi:hypothetical protein